MAADQNILTRELFEHLFNLLYERLCRSSFRIIQDEHRAEDIVQDVFCTLWRKRTELQIDSFEGYLLRSVYNASLSALKKTKAQDFKQAEEDAIQKVEDHHNPVQQLEFTETLTKIHKAIEQLPTACRTIFVLSRFENLSNKEIASELDLSVKTVENQMTKALRLLRQALLFFLFLFHQKF